MARVANVGRTGLAPEREDLGTAEMTQNIVEGAGYNCDVEFGVQV